MLVEHGGAGGHQPLQPLVSHRGQTDAHAVELARTAVWSKPLGGGLRLALVLHQERRFQAVLDELNSVGLDRVLVVTSGVDSFVDLDRADVQDLPGELSSSW
jgi:hypothetical protein